MPHSSAAKIVCNIHDVQEYLHDGFGAAPAQP
jgi:hypothetical protein